MKAAFIEQYGGPEVLKYGDLPDPIAGPSEVVIDVVAASVNGADWKVRVGQYQQSKFPFALGRDFSGVISVVGRALRSSGKAGPSGHQCIDRRGKNTTKAARVAPFQGQARIPGGLRR